MKILNENQYHLIKPYFPIQRGNVKRSIWIAGLRPDSTRLKFSLMLPGAFKKKDALHGQITGEDE